MADDNGHVTWESSAVEHTFGSGRTYRIRRSLPMQYLVLKAVQDGDAELSEGLSEWFTSGNISAAVPEGATDEQVAEVRTTAVQLAARVERSILEATFVYPRVYWDPDEMPAFHEGAPEVDEEGRPAHMPMIDLYEDEVAEALELAMSGVVAAVGFRDKAGGNRPRTRASGGGADVGKPAKRAAGSKPRKR